MAPRGGAGGHLGSNQAGEAIWGLDRWSSPSSGSLDSGPYQGVWWLVGCCVWEIGQGLPGRAGRPKAQTLGAQWDLFSMSAVVALGSLGASTQTGSCCFRSEFLRLSFLVFKKSQTRFRQVFKVV